MHARPYDGIESFEHAVLHWCAAILRIFASLDSSYDAAQRKHPRAPPWNTAATPVHIVHHA
jgi:hypothetical protein